MPRDPRRPRKASGELTRHSPDMSRKRDGNEKVTLHLAHSLFPRAVYGRPENSYARDDKSKA